MLQTCILLFIPCVCRRHNLYFFMCNFCTTFIINIESMCMHTMTSVSLQTTHFNCQTFTMKNITDRTSFELLCLYIYEYKWTIWTRVILKMNCVPAAFWKPAPHSGTRQAGEEKQRAELCNIHQYNHCQRHNFQRNGNSKGTAAGNGEWKARKGGEKETEGKERRTENWRVPLLLIFQFNH